MLRAGLLVTLCRSLRNDPSEDGELRNASSAGSEARDFRCSVACSSICRREFGEREVAWGVGACGRCGVWLVALSSLSRAGFPLDAGTLCYPLLERLSERGQVWNAKTFRELRRMLGRSPGLAAIFFRSLGGGALRNAGTMVARTVGASKVERRGRRNVLYWAIAPRFLREFKCGPQERRDVVCSVARSWSYVGGSWAKGRWPGA